MEDSRAFESQETGESRAEVSESARTIEEATFEPETFVELGGTVVEAEAVEAAFHDMQSDAEPVPITEDGDGVPDSRVENRELRPEGEEDLVTGDHRDPADAVPADQRRQFVIQQAQSPESNAGSPGSSVTKQSEQTEKSLISNLG